MATNSISVESNTGASNWFGSQATIDWLEMDPSPRIVIDGELRIEWSNASARAGLSDHGPVFVRDGFLCFDDAAGVGFWRDFFLSVGGEGARSVVQRADGQSFAVVRAFAREVGRRRLVFVTMPFVVRAMDLESCGLAKHFNLTSAEAQVAQKLVELSSPAAIADVSGVSINTVRSHIRKVYGKMAVNSQTQLLRLAHSYCES